ncbi:MAG TPA: 2,3-diphosphoglycerate-dependent phosphoglycerate mutase [Hyphomonadaceae bacterium]|nr:2,3-diphosphoglycerate-dependent phosphoglycerate mutase [Hyphomonadaceae bacterium]
MTTLVLLRHGQSAWNLADRFTGWVDVDLTAQGEAEARAAGAAMAAENLQFDYAFTSLQTRAIRTLWLALAAAEQAWLPVEKHWRLNERHYGALTGLNKTETRAKHGDEQVLIWRRSYDIAPPPIEPDSAFDTRKDRRYRAISPADLPLTESLSTTLARVLPVWNAAIAPRLRANERILIAAHGNSLRALVKELFDLTPESIVKVEIPTGNPLVLTLNAALKPLSARYLDANRAQSLPDLPRT